MGRKNLVHKPWKSNKSHSTLHNKANSGFAKNNERKGNARNNPNLSRLSDGKENSWDVKVRRIHYLDAV
jgi:hypothetical protein